MDRGISHKTRFYWRCWGFCVKWGWQVDCIQRRIIWKIYCDMSTSSRSDPSIWVILLLLMWLLQTFDIENMKFRTFSLNLKWLRKNILTSFMRTILWRRGITFFNSSSALLSNHEDIGIPLSSWYAKAYKELSMITVFF